LPSEWRQALVDGEIVPEPGEAPFLYRVMPDGSRVIEYRADGRHHELRWRSANGEEMVFHRFDASQTEAQIYGASFDGRYLAYSVVWSLSGWDNWTVFVWDTERRGSPVRVADAVRDGEGTPLPSPIPYVVAFDGRVVYTTRTGADPNDWQQTEIRSYRVADGHRAVIAVGHHTYPQLIGSTLIWRESPAPGADVKVHAYAMDTDQMVEPPAPLVDEVGISYLAAEGDTIAWINRDLKEVWAWRSGWAAPVMVYRSPEQFVYVEWVSVTNELIAWSHHELGAYVLDLRSGGYSPLLLGAAEAGGGLIVAGFPATPERPQRQAILDTRTLPRLPGC